ncbi:MAG: caspase family protein [Elusimicrobiota bacterium]
MSGPKPLLLTLTGAAALWGCATGAVLVRPERGTGVQRSFEASFSKVREALLASFAAHGGFEVTEEEDTLFVNLDAGGGLYTFYFYRSAYDKTTIVEGSVVMRHLGKKPRQDLVRAQLDRVESLLRPEEPPARSGDGDSGEKTVRGKDAPASASSAAAEPVAVASDVDRDHPKGKNRPHDFALVVGVDRYRALPRADYAERDASTMREYLEGMGVPASHVVILSGATATRGELVKHLEEWLPRNVTAKSRVYFYYAGHGAMDPGSGDAHLMPWDVDPSFIRSSAYALKDVYATLSKLKAEKVVAILDTCFSGAGGRSVIAKGTRPLVLTADPELPLVTRLSVLSAASGSEITGSLKEQGHGMFTYYVLKGLQGAADADGNKSITIKELHAYALKEVGRAARMLNREQTPQLKTTMVDFALY